MKIYGIVIGFILVIPTACNSKKKGTGEKPISATSITRGQLNHLDTSLYQITRYKINNGKTDSAWISREEIRDLAADFLSLPDISQGKLISQYTEEKLIDEATNTLSITSMARNENSEIQKQIIIISLDESANGKVNSIYIERYKKHQDSLFEQKLFWELDKFFQIGNIIHPPDQPEQSELLKVTWQ